MTIAFIISCVAFIIWGVGDYLITSAKQIKELENRIYGKLDGRITKETNLIE